MRRAARLLGLALALFGSAAQAQVAAPPVSESPIINRDRVDRQDPEIRQAAPPAKLPQAPPRVDAQAPSAITLARVRFEGATLPDETLRQATDPFVGSALDRDVLQQLANAVTALYAKSDLAFYAVSIPAQSGAGGVLTLRVVEGRIVDYALKSRTRSTPTRVIAAHVRRLMRDTPTHKSTLERTLSLLRDIPGQTVQASLRSTAKAGELVLDLDVRRKQVEVTLNLNNRGVVNVVSGVQAQVAVSINGLLREGDTTRLSGYVPLYPDRYQFYTASHATPLGSGGTTLAVSGAYVRTRTRDLGIRGEAKQLGIVVAHPLIRSYRRNLTLTASLDGTNSDNYYLDTAFGGFRTRALRLGASWSVVGKTSGYGVSTSVSQGLSGLGAQAIPGYSRTAFRKANVQATGVVQLSPALTGRVTLRGQYSRDRLPTTEHFVLGGEGAGLAFRDGFLTADEAVAGSAELSWRVLGKAPAGRGLSIFAYADGAAARSHARPLYGLRSSDYELASVGAGARITPVVAWTATAQIAVPVKKPFPGVSGKTRFFFSITRNL
ncbi:ShlB/FhaC/HecB family hemolysin secretion/activation protein [Novosphingobium soli]|uniref:ShlB/FhaC/HecB family hemolysin secretion/activation protein n=1 Tax=Novosphingobium soli TaxID=574956 RepID=A0ABV6CVC9_9SPHN